MGDYFKAEKAFSGYLPPTIGRVMDVNDFSYYYADSANVFGPEQANGLKINNIGYRSDQLANYRFGADQIYVFNDLWDVNDYNNQINITVGATTYNVVLTSGRYKLKAQNTDPDSLAIMLQTNINTVTGGSFTVTCADGVLTIQRLGSFSVSYPNTQYEYYGTRLHGIRTGFYASGIASFTPYFCYTKMIYFISDMNRYSKFDETGADGKSNIVASCILERDLNSKNTNEFYIDVKNIKYFKTNEQMSLGNFNIQLYDDNDNPLYIQNQSNFRYILRFLIRNIPN